MDYSQVVEARYSCRGFLDDPVSADQVEAIVQSAQRIPSWGNTQPWKVYATAGESAKRIRAGLSEAHRSGQPENPEIEMPQKFEGLLMDRYRGLGIELFKALGIGRGEKEKRLQHYANNFDAFNAPCLVFITIPEGQTPYVILDAGGHVTALCQSATDQGLATVVLAALARYPGPVRAEVAIPEDEKLLIGIALGYPDNSLAANRFRSPRESLDNVLRLTGF